VPLRPLQLQLNGRSMWIMLWLSATGYYAIDSLRCEKGYRAWGHELTPETTPTEAGTWVSAIYFGMTIASS
jgi:glycine cleavage system aminomethyltransferase T